MRVGYAHWSLDVPLGWNAKYDPECVTITPDSGSTALQLSSALKQVGSVTDQEILAQATREAALWGPVSTLSCGDFRGLSVSYADDEFNWRRCWLGHKNVLLFATLVMNVPSDLPRESEAFQMLQSLVYEPPGA
jgi:hypothetical protein